MGNLNIWFFFIGAIIACRSLSFAAIQWEMFGLRKSMCIERIVNEQKVCDALVGVYHLIVVCVGLWLMVMGGWEIFRDSTPPQVLCVGCPLILWFAFGIYLLLRVYLNIGYDLKDFYQNMVAYRKEQEVVTKDNDNEVSFLRTYRRVKKHGIYSVIWMVLLMVAILFGKFFLKEIII